MYKEFTSALSNDTDADFRAWVSAFIQGWKAAGLVQTADTGQINVTTIARPVALGDVGYAIFRFDDDLQATAPIFIKISFGSNSAQGTSPRVMLSVGKTTNGAGVLAGVLLAPVVVGNAASVTQGSTTVPYTHYAAGGPGWFGFLPFVDSTNYLHCFSFFIERSRSASGALSAEGLMIAYDAASSNRTMSGGTDQMVSVYGINYASGAYMLGAPPVTVPYSINGTPLSQSSSLAAGSIGPVFPWVIMAPGCVPWQSCVILSIPSGDYPGGIFTTRLCGQAATFRPVAASGPHSRWGMSVRPGGSTAGSSYIGPAIRWEA